MHSCRHDCVFVCLSGMFDRIHIAIEISYKTQSEHCTCHVFCIYLKPQFEPLSLNIQRTFLEIVLDVLFEYPTFILYDDYLLVNISIGRILATCSCEYYNFRDHKVIKIIINNIAMFTIENNNFSHFLFSLYDRTIYLFIL